MTKQFEAALAALLMVCAATAPAQQTNSTSQAGKKKTTTSARRRSTAPRESPLQKEIRELREQMINQQAQIDALKQQNLDKDQKLAAATADAATANQTANTANQQAQALQQTIEQSQTKIDTIGSDVSDLKITNVGYAQTLIETKRDLTEKIESPTTLHYKGVTIQPVGFFAFESVYRTRSLNSDVNTPFNATPYSGAGEAHTSEYNLSGRQSRLGALITGNAGDYKLTGYFEADFLSAGTTSNENQSNSYTFRQRQIFGQVANKSGLTLTAGQQWSLATETKTGTDNRTEVLPNTVDAQYQVGFTWARQASVRLQKRFSPLFTLAGSFEESQNIFSASNAPTNFFFGAPGNGGGLFSPSANYSNDPAVDIVVKAAFDTPHYGHYELAGIGRFFRDRYYANASTVAAGVTTPIPAVGAQNDNKFGGGVIGNARFPVTHFADIGIHAVYGDGTGRYGTSGLPDTTIHPDGRLALLHNGQGLFSLETHPSKKLDVYGYAGAEYVQRTTYRNAAGVLVGYAPITANNSGCGTELTPTTNSGFGPANPASCLGATRLVGETTGGFTYRFVTSPKFGRLQYQMTYSYLTRKGWAGVGGSPTATNNMVFTGLRYYIP